MNSKWIFLILMSAVSVHAKSLSETEIPLLSSVSFFESDRVSNFRITGAVATRAATSVIRDRAAEEECRRDLGDRPSYECDLGQYRYSKVVEVIVDYSAMNDNSPVRFQILASRLPAQVVAEIENNRRAKTANKYFQLNRRDYTVEASHTECRDEAQTDCYPVYSKVNKFDLSLLVK